MSNLELGVQVVLPGTTPIVLPEAFHRAHSPDPRLGAVVGVAVHHVPSVAVDPPVVPDAPSSLDKRGS